MKVFLSAPISASDTHDYDLYNHTIIELKYQLLKLPSIDEVFYAGEGLKDNNDFESPESALIEDIGELRDADIFLFIYPKKIATSAIFEAGVAFELKKRLFFYHKKNEELPYLMRGINDAHIFEYKKLSEIYLDFEVNWNK